MQYYSATYIAIAMSKQAQNHRAIINIDSLVLGIRVFFYIGSLSYIIFTASVKNNVSVKASFGVFKKVKSI